MIARILLLVVFLLSACHDNSALDDVTTKDHLFNKQYFIFGTIIEVLIWHHDKQVVEQALRDVEKSLNGMHHQWHAWKAGRLHEINQALRSGQSFTLTDEETQFIQQTQQLSRLSFGYFNPAIGELIHLWGFHTDNYPITTPPPSEAEINRFLKNAPSMADIQLKDNKISSTNSHIWLDYGGVAKGYAIDKAIKILQEYGIENAIVNAGGDLRSIGSKGDNNWQVAIRKPNSSDIIAVIPVKEDESIFTSGNYERYKEFNGKRYAHIINPTTGYGIGHIISATVIAKNGTKADAAATAMVVAGKKNWLKVAKSLQLQQFLLIDDDDKCYATQALLGRIKKLKTNCQVIQIQ